MNNLLEEAIEEGIRLYDLKVGDGDLTTETLSPYARHTEAEIVAKESVPWFPFVLFDALMKRGDSTLLVQTNDDVQPPFSPGGVVVRIEGNGRAIVTGWQVVGSVVSFLSSIYSDVQNAVNALKSARIDVTHNFDLPVMYDKLIRYAVEEGGGVSTGSRLDEMIYLSQDHIAWSGSVHSAMKRMIREVGDKRSLIKVIVELRDPNEASYLKDLKADLVYCKHFDVAAIGKVKQVTQGWVSLMVDETIPLDEAKSLRSVGVRSYMINVNRYLISDQLFTIRFSR